LNQEFQEFQAFQAFQEMATHFNSISRGFKSCQAFQEHISRALETLETPGAHRQTGKIARSVPAWVSKSFQEFQEFQAFQVFQEAATHFKSISRGFTSCQLFQVHCAESQLFANENCKLQNEAKMNATFGRGSARDPRRGPLSTELNDASA